jgi:hypothetical protein
MAAVFVLTVLAGSLLPEAESPLPDRIGLDFPFTVSGLFVTAAEIRFARVAPRRRERGIYQASLMGLSAGFALYAASLVAQLL